MALQEAPRLPSAAADMKVLFSESNGSDWDGWGPAEGAGRAGVWLRQRRVCQPHAAGSAAERPGKTEKSAAAAAAAASSRRELGLVVQAVLLLLVLLLVLLLGAVHGDTDGGPDFGVAQDGAQHVALLGQVEDHHCRQGRGGGGGGAGGTKGVCVCVGGGGWGSVRAFRPPVPPWRRICRPCGS